MAARPPGGNEDSEPDVVEFGIAAVAARLESTEITYPIGRAELERRLGDVSIPYDAAGNEVTLSTALSELDRDRFENETELLDALHPVFERYRVERGSSVLGRVRSLLPF